MQKCEHEEFPVIFIVEGEHFPKTQYSFTKAAEYVRALNDTNSSSYRIY